MNIASAEIELETLTIDELEEVIIEAKQRIVQKRRQNERLRDDLAKKARAANLSPEDTAILFG